MRHITSFKPAPPPTLKRVVKRAIRTLTHRDLTIRRVGKPLPTINERLVAQWDAATREQAVGLDFGVFDVANRELYVTHEAGLYSCLSVTLWCLADLLSEGLVPRKINFTQTLASYRDRPNQDLYPALFLPGVDEPRLAKLLQRPRSDFQRFDHHGDYRKLPYRFLTELIGIYFRPNPALAARTQAIQDRYIRPDARYVGVCFRGTDKGTEVLPIDSSVYLETTETILADQEVDRVLIQTDQAQVGRLFQSYFAGRCDLIDKLPRTTGMVVIHQGDSIHGSRVDFAMDMISAVTILSRMERVIVYTGNIGAWIALLRGSSEGVWQATPQGISRQWTP